MLPCAAVTCRLHDTFAHCYNPQIGVATFGGIMETKELESLDVLVVDDDAFLREICATLLRELGVRSITEAKHCGSLDRRFRCSMSSYATSTCP